MPNGVGIPVHHQERIFPARNYKMLGVIARPSRRFQKIAVARFLLEVLDPPRGPERFYFLLWKFVFGHAYRPLKLKSCAAKSSEHFHFAVARNCSAYRCFGKRTRLAITDLQVP